MRRWQGRKGARVVRWQGAKGGRVVKWQGRRFLVFFKNGGHRVTPRFHLFVSDVYWQWRLRKLVTIEIEEIRRLRMRRLREWRMRRLTMRRLLTKR